MKRMILAIAAAMMISATTMAQENNDSVNRRPRMDMTEMVKQRTDETVQRYGLNEEQAAKLLELNTKYAGQMRPGRGMRRGGGRGMAPDGAREHRGMAPDSAREHRGMAPDGAREHRDMASDSAREHRQPNGNMGRMAGRQRGQGPMQGRDEWRKSMEEYDNELKAILTEEQYAAYKADMEKRRTEMPRRRGQGQ